MMDSKGQRYGSGKDANMNKLNEIHMCNLKKEARSLDKNRTKHFQLNPNHVFLLPKKPQQQIPAEVMKVNKKKGPKMKSAYTEDPVEEAFSNEKLRSTLQSVRMLPRQKYDEPQ